MANQADSSRPTKASTFVSLIDSGFEHRKADVTVYCNAKSKFDRKYGVATIQIETGAVWLQSYASADECRRLAEALLNAARVIEAIPAQAEAA